jgi:hypothetical protein
MLKHLFTKKSDQSLFQSRRRKINEPSIKVNKIKIDFDSYAILEQIERSSTKHKLKRKKYEYANKLSIAPELDTIRENKVLTLGKMTPISQDLKIYPVTKDSIEEDYFKKIEPKTSTETENYFFRKMAPISKEIETFSKPKTKSRINCEVCNPNKFKKAHLAVEIIRLLQLIFLVAILGLTSFLMAIVSSNASLLITLTIISLSLILTLMVLGSDYFKEYFYAIIDTIVFVLMIVLLEKCYNHYSNINKNIKHFYSTKSIELLGSNQNQLNVNSLLGMICFIF